MMEQLFQSGYIPLAIVGIMAVEALVLAQYLRKFPGVFAGLGAGICLTLALRACLLHQEWPVIAVLLLLSGLCHVTEIWHWLRLARSD